MPVSQGVGVEVGVAVAVAVAVGEAVGVAVGVGVGASVAVGVTLGVPVGVGVGVGDGHGTSVAVTARHFDLRHGCRMLPGVCCPPVASQMNWVKVVSSRFTPTTSWLSFGAGALTM
jgi:hypothetical protein